MKVHSDRLLREPVRPGAAAAQKRQPVPGSGGSARDVAQRERMDAAFGPTQRVGEDDELQMKTADALQRLAPEDEEPLQGKSDGAAPAAPGMASNTGGGGLPTGLRSGIEALSGMDLSDVQVHSGSSKPAEIDALAYTQGNDIHVAPGQEQHLAHEAWHVVQQRQGRVVPTMEVGGVHVNDDVGLEAEADKAGSMALQIAGRVAQ